MSGDRATDLLFLLGRVLISDSIILFVNVILYVFGIIC